MLFSSRPTGALCLAVCVFVLAPFAQFGPAMASAAEPPSFSTPLERDAPALALWTAPPVDVPKLLAEDALRDGIPAPVRVGFPMKSDLSPARGGSWAPLPDGSRVWRVQVSSKDALWIALGFGTFRLQPGGVLWAYDPARETVRGPYTSADVHEHGQLWLAPIAGDTVIVELLWPKDLADETPNIHLGTVSHGYKPWGGIGRAKDEPGVDAGSCNIDVNCPLGDDWQDEKRGVVNLLSGGSGYCSGSLIVTSARDCENYVLTAAHCLSSSGEAASTVFQFNFERPACGSGTPPSDQTSSGSTLVATTSASDATLLRMSNEPLEAFDAYYNGWSRSTTASPEAWCIHHPNNDEKKISYNDDTLLPGENYGPNHWRIDNWEQGTTEPGSSGSPLFDQNSRIIGQLHGGTASCSSITYDEFGKLDVSWEGGGAPSSRLRDWLDPGNTGAVTQDGLDWDACQVPQPRLAYKAHVAGDAAGNGDGIVDPGERIVLEIDVVNQGTLGATNVAGTLTALTATAALVDDAALYPDIPSLATRRSLVPHYTVDVAETHICGDPLTFSLALSASEAPGSWTSEFSLPTGTAAVETTFFDDMESGTESWTVETPSGSNPFTISTASAFSGTQSWFVNDIATVSDSILALAEISSLAGNAELRFRHRVNAENNYDGGVLEYSANGGAWTDAGALIAQGGYTGTISTGYESPLGGRQAWSGDNGDWQLVRVDLSSLAGSSLRLRWRFATDSSVSDEGWFIDDVVIDRTEYICNGSGLARPGEASDPDGGGPPFTIGKVTGGYQLAWSEPNTGGAPAGYRLYRTPLSSPTVAECEADLGSGTSAQLATLTNNRGFLVVAHNAAGEGSYGATHGGDERTPSSSPCP